MAEPMDYASAGVDIDLEGSAVASLIASLSASSRPAGTPGAPVDLPGGFGGLIEFGDSLLALATDGVGSKLQIASALKQWGGVGIDCMAMNVNDLLCVGAEPIAFVDYVAVPKPDPETHAALGASLAEACRLARVTLAGGETASLPGIVTELDLSGTALGYVKKGNAITGEHLEAGDVLIGLPSSGIHSNGYSLVRRVMEHTGHEYTDDAPFNVASVGRSVMHFDGHDDAQFTLGEVFLNPTRIYCDPIVDLLKHAETDDAAFALSDIRAICHVTGGGLSNLLRLHESLGWHIDAPLPPHPEFNWLQEVGGIETREMYRTFNMGTGMIIAVSSEHADSIAAWLEERMLGTRIIGQVNDQGHKVTHALEGVEFSHY
ncbi:MAG: phosphoribosylformylglycinamidine cyclo-ligase [Euryarchaeota archaeon]|jgi:phosphoribosylformylglycinamidine cyclo-ligase|nr:phosphoribosylformylglycinamidine cyclo-ligase [Euryarchaeota archaeon]